MEASPPDSLGNPAQERKRVTYRQVEKPSEVVVFLRLDLRKEVRGPEYGETCARMNEIVSAMPGFISIKEYTSEGGESVEIARFASAEALEAWRTQLEHRQAQRRGLEFFYGHYWIQVCKVIREYEFWRDDGEKVPESPSTPSKQGPAG